MVGQSVGGTDGQTVGWLVGWMDRQTVGQLVSGTDGWLWVGWSVGQRTDRRLVGRSVGWSVVPLVGRSVSWSVGRSVGRLVGRSVGRLICHPVRIQAKRLMMLLCIRPRLALPHLKHQLSSGGDIVENIDVSLFRQAMKNSSVVIIN